MGHHICCVYSCICSTSTVKCDRFIRDFAEYTLYSFLNAGNAWLLCLPTSILNTTKFNTDRITLHGFTSI
ncbi:Uncharacterised protein [Acinetobacter baumannii]|nr:Uncharacterised protein [Acinetobacter baumannii]